jgi:arylsulfatase A-like enzyme
VKGSAAKTRPVRPWLRGACAGGLALIALFGGDLLSLRLGFMGFSDAGAAARIVREYRGDIVRTQLALLALLATVGASFGLLGALLGEARARARGPKSEGGRPGFRSRLRSLVWGASAALVTHALLWMRHLVLYPQLYTEGLYDRGGLRRAFMLALTRHTRPSTFVFVGAALLLALLPGAIDASTIPRTRRRIDSATKALADALRVRRGLRAAALSMALLAIGVSVAHVLRPRATPTAPNLLLIAIDSLRTDRVFGPGARRFPALSLLASRSARFRQAHVTVPRTFPSFVTLLTGRYPHHHGIRHMLPSAAQRAHIGPSLPATLADAGWRTAVASDYAGEIFARTPLGFQTVDAPRFDMHALVAQLGLQVHLSALPYAAGIAEPLFPWVRGLSERADPALLGDRAVRRLTELVSDAQGREGKPFFATVFFSTPHFPYAAPYPYYERFVDPLYEGPFLYDKPPLSAAAVGPEDARHIQALYDGAVAAVDEQLARLLRVLEDSGAADHTIVVVLADHGENLWEDPRAGMGHGEHLIGERAVRVPLLIYDPRPAVAGGRAPVIARDIDALVRDVDLVPTLATLLGVRAPPGDGVDLAPLLSAERDDLDLPAFAETEYWFVPTGPGFSADERIPYPAVTGATDFADDGDIFMRPEIEPLVITAKHRALRLGAWKLVYRPTRSGALLTLYDLSHDPEERIDVSARFPEQLALMRDRLYAWMLDDVKMVQRGDFVVPR